jgi:SAM-dependent methyltransferase
MGPERSDVPSYARDQAYFNRYTEGYAPYTEGDLDLILTDLIGAVPSAPLSCVCEIGCADGQFSAELVRRLGDRRPGCFLGLDIAHEVLKRFPFERLRASAFEIPLRPHSLDGLWYVGSLHHLAPFPAALAEAVRTLKPGGLLYMMEPNALHPQRRLFMSPSALYRWYRDTNDTPIDPYALTRELDRLGFQILALRFVTIAFRDPGVLQRIQNALSAVPWPTAVRPYLSPWFILLARKRER